MVNFFVLHVLCEARFQVTDVPVSGWVNGVCHIRTFIFRSVVCSKAGICLIIINKRTQYRFISRIYIFKATAVRSAHHWTTYATELFQQLRCDVVRRTRRSDSYEVMIIIVMTTSESYLLIK